jgi:Rrf2 family iron-sulfur cluster assembly transcriptional regulator
VQIAPERRPYSPIEKPVALKEVKLAGEEKKKKGESQKVIKTTFKKVEDVPRGPNSIFSFADYLNRGHSVN